MSIRNFASEAFGPSGGGLLIPRQKFQFTLVLHTVDNGLVQFPRISTVSQASYNFDTQIVNQYNKKRVIQSKINYDPVSVSFYDTHDSEWHNIWKRYVAFYYNAGRGLAPKTSSEGRETTVPAFETDQGFTPNPDRYFLPEVMIVQHGIGSKQSADSKHRVTKLINPMVVNMNGDTLDYSDSQPVQYSVTFQPESVVTEEVNGQFNINTTTNPSIAGSGNN